jgi:hypothetical protein
VPVDELVVLPVRHGQEILGRVRLLRDEMHDFVSKRGDRQFAAVTACT